MPSKPIDRLMFAQGGQCFFCQRPLPRAEASVEHLVALTHGGKDHDENCVACCKGLNALFGRMSLKEKLQIVLRQKGDFSCPLGLGSAQPAPASSKPVAKAAPATKALSVASPMPRSRSEKIQLILTDLRKRGNARPGSTEKLINTIRSLLLHQGEVADEAGLLFNDLVARGVVAVVDGKITYQLA